MRWSAERYARRFPEYNRNCVTCGAPFNALYLGDRRRITCSRECAREHARQVQRENTRRYVKTEKYKAYRVKYYEAVKARRRLARISDALAGTSPGKGAEA